MIVGDEKNRREWKKGRVVCHVQGGDGVIRGVILQHKGHQIERLLSLVCPLEIRRSSSDEDKSPSQPSPVIQPQGGARNKRQAAETAREKIKLIAEDKNDD